MGRWAQARRRGGRKAGQGPLGPPTPPQVIEIGGNLVELSLVASDLGGRLRLWTADAPEGPFVQTEDVPWVPAHNFGAIAGFEGSVWAGTEVGNGSDYVGESALGPPLDLR